MKIEIPVPDLKKYGPYLLSLALPFLAVAWVWAVLALIQFLAWDTFPSWARLAAMTVAGFFGGFFGLAFIDHLMKNEKN